MSRISEDKLRIVRGLLDQAPDSAVRSLLAALSGGDLDAGLRAVKAIVEAEAADRKARNLVLTPIVALCTATPAHGAIAFPPRTLGQIWRGLKATSPAEVARAANLVVEWRPDTPPTYFNALCLSAATGLRAGEHPQFQAAAASAKAGSGLDALVRCLDLAAPTRAALARLPDWIGRMTDERAAHLRLAYKDAVAVAEDAGPLFFEMLAAKLAEPWLMLRVVSGAMGHPGEAYLAASELASFGERILEDIDMQVAVVTAFNRNSGPAAAAAAAEAAQRATIQIAEVEQAIELSPDGPWGRQVAADKRNLAMAIELRLRDVDDAVGHALPLKTIRLGPRTLRGVPKLNADPDPVEIERARTLIAFLHAVQGSAQAGGFASARAKALEILDARLSSYVEDILESLRTREIEDEPRARAFLEIAAGFCGLAHDNKAADLVRRRAAAA